MSGVRHASKKDAPQTGDLEAQSLIDYKKGTTGDSFNAPPGSSRNPVFLAKVIFRKVIDLASSGSDEDPITTPSGFFAMVRDIIIGIVMGILTISILVFLDHHNIIHLQSAHNFRESAFALVNDPETLTIIEESSDLKFVTLTSYEAQLKEIKEAPAKIAILQKRLVKIDAEKLEKQKQIDEIRDTHTSMTTNPILELDKFCGSCRWEGTTCEARVAYLKGTYSIAVAVAKVGAMNNPSCKKEA